MTSDEYLSSEMFSDYPIDAEAYLEVQMEKPG